MIKNILAKGTLGLAATSMALAGLGGIASAQQPMMQPTTQDYVSHMTSLNGSGASGTAHVSVTGDQVTVLIKSHGLSANLPHAQHIHIGGQHMCPTLMDDANHDGLISTSEGMDAYGDALIGLTTSGDVSVNSELAVPRYPVANKKGVVVYKRTFTLPTGVTAADVAGGVVVQHGVSSIFDNPTMYDGAAKDLAVSTTLPLEATIPADCGVLVNVTPKAMNNSGSHSVGFDNSVNAALGRVQSATGRSDVTTAFSSAYAMATADFNQSLATATTSYDQMSMTNAAVAKDMYMNTFNNAKATYFNSLEAARNNLVSSLSGSNDVTKDMFVNSYNSARDLYSNQLEMTKNSIGSEQ
jgi:hypothetical protein